MPACREAAMARAQVVEVAGVDAAAGDAIVHTAPIAACGSLISVAKHCCIVTW